MNDRERAGHPLMQIVLGGLCIFFLFASAVTVFLFLLGNYQAFTVRSQELLLRLVKTTSLFCALCGFNYIVYLFIRLFPRNRPGPASYLLAAASLGFGVLALAAAQFILVLTLPV